MKPNFQTTMLSALLIAAAATPAFAERGTSSGTRGGGDDSGLEVQSMALEAVQDIRSLGGDLAAKLDLGKVEAEIKNIKFAIVDQTLPSVTIRGVLQKNPVAINYPKKRLVEANRDRWKGLPDVRVKKATALHEVLSVMEIESSGSYVISSVYLNAMGYHAEADENMPVSEIGVGTQFIAKKDLYIPANAYFMYAQGGDLSEEVNFRAPYCQIWLDKQSPVSRQISHGRAITVTKAEAVYSSVLDYSCVVDHIFVDVPAISMITCHAGLDAGKHAYENTLAGLRELFKSTFDVVLAKPTEL